MEQEGRPNKKKRVSIHLVTLPDTPKRDFYFSTILSTDADPLPATNLDTQNTFLQLHAALAMNILLSVGDTESSHLSVDQFSTSGFLEHGPVPFTIKLKNKGPHLSRPHATILITNMFGQKVGKISLDEVTILAGTTRYIPSHDYRLPDTMGTPAALWNEAILFGPYTATLTVEQSDTNEKIAKTVHFGAMPYNRLGAVFLIAAVIIVIFLQVKRRLNS